MTPRHLSAALAATLLTSTLLAACGGDDDDTAAPPSSAASSTSDAPTSGSASASSSAEPAGSDDGGGAGEVDTSDPCTILTPAEISAAVGGTVGKGELSPPDQTLGNASCIWSTGTGVLPYRSFQVSLTTDDSIKVDGYSASRLYEDTLKQFPATTADGIGDKAAFSDNKGYVLKGETYMSTSIGFGSSDVAKDALRTLTAKAAGRL